MRCFVNRLKMSQLMNIFSSKKILSNRYFRFRFRTWISHIPTTFKRKSLRYLPLSFFLANAIVGCTGFGPADSDWLMWLCIAFGGLFTEWNNYINLIFVYSSNQLFVYLFSVLFAVMLLINIFLCSAMTCSCTRSEIIEKEPSVYDDYSIYDSQYG